MALAGFWGYIGLVCVAGFWGAFINPWFDHRWLFHMNVRDLPNYERVNMLSQYRFLRALELGFGVISVAFVKEIFSLPRYTRLFLFGMGAGILARLTSLVFDGKPSGWMWAFMVYEIIAWMLIFLFMRKHIYAHRNLA